MQEAYNHLDKVVFYDSNSVLYYSAFQIDELHRHNQNLVGTFCYATCLRSIPSGKRIFVMQRPYCGRPT